jgi:Subtilase family
MNSAKWQYGVRNFLAVLVLGTGGAGSAMAQTPDEIEMVRDSWIFVFADALPATDVRPLAERATENAGGKLGHVYAQTIRGFSARMSAQAAERLAASNPHIRYYEADQVARVIKRPSGPGGGGTTQPSQEIPWGINRVSGGVDGSAVGTAWVIDTGVDQNHPDLNVDTARSISFVSRGRYSVDDGNGHGTHVAGTIAAVDNAIGVIGVAAGAKVVGVRVLDSSGSGSYSDVIAGIDYVGAQGLNGDVANISLGGGFSQALNDAVIAASGKVKFAIAAGNESTDANGKSPASANGPNIYTVSAFAEGDNWAWFSNYGNPPIDCAAPGVGIYSTYKDGGYETLSGTSMAAPHVAGILLLGTPLSAGNVNGDPDGYPDAICAH